MQQKEDRPIESFKKYAAGFLLLALIFLAVLTLLHITPPVLLGYGIGAYILFVIIRAVLRARIFT